MIVVEQDTYGNIHLRHDKWAGTEPGRCVFTMTWREWEDLLYRAASYELERRKLPQTRPLADTLGNRLM